MPLDFLKKILVDIGGAFKKALESFGYLALFLFGIVVAYIGIDAALYVFSKGIEGLQMIIDLIPSA